MDLSKLPKLSGNRDADKPQAGAPQDLPADAAPPAAPPTSPSPAPIAYEPRMHEAPTVGPDAPLSLVIGAVLMMVGRGFAEWLFATLAGKVYDTGVVWQSGAKAGQTVAYWDLEGFTAISESTVFIFGLALVVDGIVLLTARLFPRTWTKLLFGSFLLTILATVCNGAAIVIFLTQNGPMPIWATLLTGLGAYTAWQQWRLLRYGMAGA